MARSYENLKDEAADYIRAAIVSGRYPARSKVDQDEIAEALGISRAPVREAIIELAQKGFVVTPPRRGAFVAELTASDIEDYYEVVAAVFGMTTRRAIAKLTSAEIDELRRLDRDIAATSDEDRRKALDRRFFDVIVGSGRSPRLDSILQLLGGMFQASFYSESPGWAANEASFRRQLLAAVEAADELLAARASEEHLRACAAAAIEYLRTSGYWTTPAPLVILSTNRGGTVADEPGQIPLVDYLVLGDDPHLIAHECQDCRARFFDRRNACAACSGTRFATVDIPREGTVRTFTIVSLAAPGVPVPFVAAVIDCGGTSVRGNLVNVDPDPKHVTLGMKVRLTTIPIGTDSAGVTAVGYGFEPGQQ